MENTIKKQKFDGTEVEVLGETYEDGLPAVTKDTWRGKFLDRGDMLKYLKNGERYWYNSERGFGSEKRKNPA